jgi:hypothetical protein
MPRSKTYSNLQKGASDRAALQQLRADQLIDKARLNELEAKVAQQAEQIMGLEAAATA